MQQQAAHQPSAWVARFAPLIPPGEVLDLACGSGRHARLLASLGHPVLALDRDADALARTSSKGIRTLQYDLEAGAPWPFPAARFSGIVVTNYLHRPLMASLGSSLKQGGILIYETYAVGNALFGKPANADFLLQHGELLQVAVAADLRVLAFEDGYVEHPRPAMIQRICLKKSAAGGSPQEWRLD
jgi:SAM-dependent methyltransferase